MTSWNPTAEQLFDYRADEAIGRNIDDLVATREEVRAEAQGQTQHGMSGGSVRSITRRTRKDGSLVDVEVFGAPVIVAGEPVGLYAMYHDIRDLQQARRDAEAATEAKSAFLANDEPRDPHADERGDRHDRSAARHGADTPSSVSSPRSSAAAATPCSPSSTTSWTSPRSRPGGSTSTAHRSICASASKSALELVAARPLSKGLELAYRPRSATCPARCRRRHAAAPGPGQPARATR